MEENGEKFHLNAIFLFAQEFMTNLKTFSNNNLYATGVTLYYIVPDTKHGL